MCRLQTAEYSADPQIAVHARQWLRRLLDRWQLSELADDASLLLTELVTNAMRHAQSQVHVVAAVADGVFEVGVADHDPRLQAPRLSEPLSSQQALDSVAELREGGRGLLLVSHIADDWGVAALDGGKQVWFRLAVAHAWADRAGCPCEDQHLQRHRLDSGRYAVAVAGPWDQPPHDSHGAATATA